GMDGVEARVGARARGGGAPCWGRWSGLGGAPWPAAGGGGDGTKWREIGELRWGNVNRIPSRSPRKRSYMRIP
ncbi:hypothetical protein KI387_037708, partial [Taxus chinensis]